MGAEYIEHTFDAASRDEVERIVAGLQCEAIANYGTSYSGDLGSAESGVDFSEEIFNSQDAASEYVSEHHKKWDAPLAVRYRVPAETPKLAALKKKKADLLDKNKDILWQSPYNVVGNAVHKRMTTQSAKYKKCGSCGSSVSVAHLNSAACPVCHTYTAFFTAGDHKKVETVVAKAKAVKEKMDAIQQLVDAESSKSNTFKWYIGCWCSS